MIWKNQHPIIHSYCLDLVMKYPAVFPATMHYCNDYLVKRHMEAEWYMALAFYKDRVHNIFSISNALRRIPSNSRI
ncbi:MAG: hypothetical protein MHMPM18_004650 [Marteilia pararefringens]